MVAAGSILVTGSFASYRSLAARGWKREIVNHLKNIYVNENGIRQAQIETYWKHLKRSFRATHLEVSMENARKYITSFKFIYNSRKAPMRFSATRFRSSHPFLSANPLVAMSIRAIRASFRLTLSLAHPRCLHVKDARKNGGPLSIRATRPEEGTSILYLQEPFADEDSVIAYLLECQSEKISTRDECGSRFKLYPVKVTRKYSGY